MINHFRTKLMNLDYEVLLPEDYIAPDFEAVVLPPVLENFHDLLFPSSLRSQIVLRANAYTNLLHAFDLDDVIVAVDSRVTYKLSELDTFDSVVDNLHFTADEVISNTQTYDMLNYGEQNYKLRNMFEQSPFNLQRLAASIAAYSLKLQ